MEKVRYCYDSCKHNKIEREHWNDVEGGKSKSFSRAKTGTNQKLQCELGYKQLATTPLASLHSVQNGAEICPTLRKLL
jgi:hypothetical protein